jgi:hypothetical protein
MAVERAAGGTSLIDVLDRVLDKGIVIDAWVRASLVGIDLITVEGAWWWRPSTPTWQYRRRSVRLRPCPARKASWRRTSWPKTSRCAPSWRRQKDARRAVARVHQLRALSNAQAPGSRYATVWGRL